VYFMLVKKITLEQKALQSVFLNKMYFFYLFKHIFDVLFTFFLNFLAEIVFKIVLSIVSHRTLSFIYSSRWAVELIASLVVKTKWKTIYLRKVEKLKLFCQMTDSQTTQKYIAGNQGNTMIISHIIWLFNLILFFWFIYFSNIIRIPAIAITIHIVVVVIIILRFIIRMIIAAVIFAWSEWLL